MFVSRCYKPFDTVESGISSLVSDYVFFGCYGGYGLLGHISLQVLQLFARFAICKMDVCPYPESLSDIYGRSFLLFYDAIT
jgi:hypothetical protein